MECMTCNEEAIAKYVWNIAKKADNLSIRINKTNIERIWRRVTRKAKGRYRRSLIKSVLVALIYHTWWARNGALWNKAVTRLTTILKMIKEETRSRT
ncbi:hypothetical protein H5410_042000, partial [Solanum commersonii]